MHHPRTLQGLHERGAHPGTQPTPPAAPGGDLTPAGELAVRESRETVKANLPALIEKAIREERRVELIAVGGLHNNGPEVIRGTLRRSAFSMRLRIDRGAYDDYVNIEDIVELSFLPEPEEASG